MTQPTAVTRVTWNVTEENRLKREFRDKVLQTEGSNILRTAQADAPRSRYGSHGRAPGYLASQIRMTEADQAEGPGVRISTNARTPQGFRYGAYWQRRRPYLRASVSLTKG
jgi:hypothetical protein